MDSSFHPWIGNPEIHRWTHICFLHSTTPYAGSQNMNVNWKCPKLKVSLYTVIARVSMEGNSRRKSVSERRFTVHCQPLPHTSFRLLEISLAEVLLRLSTATSWFHGFHTLVIDLSNGVLTTSSKVSHHNNHLAPIDNSWLPLRPFISDMTYKVEVYASNFMSLEG